MIFTAHRRNWLVIVGIFWIGMAGCSRRIKPAETKRSIETETTNLQLARLDPEPTVDVCHEVLQSLDSSSFTRENRPKLTDAARKELGEFATLSDSEIKEINSETFTELDPFYLEECLLLRDSARSLNMANATERQKASLAFDFVCRQIYLEMRNVPVVPPWFSLEGGTGSALDRAYAFLGLLQQMKIDGCLIGPPAILEKPVALMEKRKDDVQRIFTPIRAVGARVGKDIFLFDPWKGKPIPDASGTGIATLAQLRNNPDQLKEWTAKADWKPEEIKTWEVLVSCPISALSPRMKWLEELMADTSPIKLHLDVLAIRDRMVKEAGEKGCKFWNPHSKNPNDAGFQFTYPQILRSFHLPHKLTNGSTLPPLKMLFLSQYEKEFVPQRFKPVMVLRDRNNPNVVSRERVPGQEWIDQVYTRPVRDLFFHIGSPRDRILRGQFTDANLALSTLKEEQDGIIRQAKEIQDPAQIFEAFTQRAIKVYSDEARAENSKNPSAIEAAQAEKMKWQKNPYIYLIILSNSAKLVLGEAAYLTAVCAQEKAERHQALLESSPNDRLKAESAMIWGNAKDFWENYLNNHPELRPESGPLYPARDAHAKIMFERCEKFSAPRGK